MWHLVLKNLKGRGAYNVIIAFAVALAVATVFVAVFMSSGVQNELAQNPRLMGADLAVVPSGTKEKGQVYLLKGPPAQGALPSDVVDLVIKFSEVEAVTSQKIVGSALMGGVQVSLIAFDAATDFVVQPWLDKKSSGTFQAHANGIVLGARVDAKKVPGDMLELNGKSLLIAGRLQETDTFLDTSIFLPSETQITEASWVLLRLTQGTLLDYMTNKLETNLSHIEIISRPEMLKTIDDQLYGLLEGGGFNLAALLVVIGALLVTGAMFSLMVHERKREFGLLKAMGARNTFVFRLVIGEAAALGSLGGGLGILFSLLWLLLTHSGFASGELSAVAFMTLVFSRLLPIVAMIIVVGVLTALYPALFAARLEPYAAIRSGE